jgi:tetratricopeptide (TPR) repeat protein
MALFCGLKIWRYRKDDHIRGIACVLFVILCKETSQATLLLTKYLCFLIILLLAYVSSLSSETIKLRKSKFSVLLTSCFLFIFFNVYWAYNNGKMTSDGIKAGLNLLKSEKGYDAEQVRVIENLRKASRKEPFDNYIKYILAEIDIRQGKVKEGATQLSELNKKHPNNAVFAFSCGNAFFILGDKDKAIGYWKEGIILYPRLLLCKEYLNIESVDPTLFKCLNDEILRSYPKGKQIEGKESAKWGFILNKFGKTEESIRLLRHSVSELPNLSVPWLILNVPTKYNFLTNGLFFNYSTSMKVEDDAPFELNDLLTAVYGVRFKTWYADNL